MICGIKSQVQEGPNPYLGRPNSARPKQQPALTRWPFVWGPRGARPSEKKLVPRSLMPGFVQVSNRVFGDTDWDLPFLRDPPGVVKPCH